MSDTSEVIGEKAKKLFADFKAKADAARAAMAEVRQAATDIINALGTGTFVVDGLVYMVSRTKQGAMSVDIIVPKELP